MERSIFLDSDLDQERGPQVVRCSKETEKRMVQSDHLNRLEMHRVHLQRVYGAYLNVEENEVEESPLHGRIYNSVMQAARKVLGCPEPSGYQRRAANQ